MLDPRWQKVARDLWANKSRTVLVALSIAVGVITFGALLIARGEFTSNLRDQYRAANAFDIAIDLPPFDESLARWVEGQPYVTAAQGMTVFLGKLIVAGHEHNLTLTAYDDSAPVRINRLNVAPGMWPPDRGTLLIERSFLDRVDLRPGDSVWVELGADRRYRMTYAGAVHDITAQSGLVNPRIQGYIARRSLYALDAPVHFNRLYITIQPPPAGLAALFPNQPSANEIADMLREQLRQRGLIARSIEVNQRREHWAAAQLDGLALIMTLVGSLALGFSGFLVVNVVNGLLLQQKRFIGVMKIVGGRRVQIIAVYLAMVACFGLLALILALPVSVALAYALTLYIGPATLNFDLLHFSLPPEILALEIGVAVLAPMLFALFPILSATRLSAAQAISDYVVRARAGLVDVALARLERLPRPALMAVRGTFRQKSRLALTMVTLTLAGALFMAIMNVSEAVTRDVRKSLGMSTFDVQAGLIAPAARQSVEARAKAVEGVVDAEGWATTSVTRVRPDGVLGSNFTLYGVPPGSRFASPSLAQGRWLGDADPNRRDIVVTTAFITNRENDVRVGDWITLRRGNSRSADKSWRVVGVVNAQAPAAYASLNDVTDFAGIVADGVNLLNLRTGDASIGAQQRVAASLTRAFNDRWNMRVGFTMTRTDVVNNVLEAFNIVIVVLFVVALMIAVVGGLGLAGAMSLSVIERTREIGVMRSVGGRTNTLRGMFVTEGLLIGLISFLVALPLSLPITLAFDHLLAGALRLSPFTFLIAPQGPPCWLSLVVVISIISSLTPAQRATQISIREALAYE